MLSFYSHGKLLITSEYLVLDGAVSLAVPTKLGQSLTVTENNTQKLIWKSVLHDNTPWFETEINIPLPSTTTSDNPIIQKLYEILKAAKVLNPTFLEGDKGYEVVSTLEFPRDWGLGSSSTLIANIALWATINPYELLKMTFGGSGYDIACASSNTPITYTNKETTPEVNSVVFDPVFKEKIFFIHLNKKQNSRDSISHYKNLDTTERDYHIKEFTALTKEILASQDSLSRFEDLLLKHESKLSEILQTPTIKEQLFSDYPNAIKSLGGWGGDFILAIGAIEDMEYFKEKGYYKIIPYSEMLLH
ncbi:GYDIA family GHMP kinase [Dokdonia ponticola]|uniref:GYDIA family GHMP kinase n=1 Tax=Dokdonia ponticola TaxID=2041041 RepID=A0ABV9HZW1_9FLAO